jgi:hypothetical protein
MNSKKNIFVWLFSILANYGFFLLFLAQYEYGSGSAFGIFADEIASNRVEPTFYMTLGVGLALTLVSIFISGFEFKDRNLIFYGLPVVGLLYSFAYIYSCNGKFCGVYGILGIIASAIFIIFFTLGIYLRKWSIKVVSTLLIIEVVGLALWTVYLMFN